MTSNPSSMRGIYTTYLKHHLAKHAPQAKAYLAYARALFLIYWQPVAVVGGAILCVLGVFYTVARLTVWLAPALGYAPAATLAGALITRLALRWAKMAIQREENQ